MSDVQSLNATFFAFRKREKGGVLLGATLAYLVLAILGGVVFLALNASSLASVLSWYAQIVSAAASGDEAAVASMTPPASLFMLIPSYLLGLLYFFILFSAWEAACLKWMIHGETSGFMGLSFGAPTWRVWSTYWVYLGLVIVFEIVLLILIGIFAALFAGAMGNGGDAGPAMALGMLLPLLLIVGIIFVAVRLAPAAAASVARKKFAFFDAWKITRGRFWAIFGAFLLLFLIYFVAAIVLYFVCAMGLMGPLMAGVGQMGPQSDPSAAMAAIINAFTQPSTMIVMGLCFVAYIVLASVLRIAFFGVNARAAIAALDEGKIEPPAGA